VDWQRVQYVDSADIDVKGVGRTRHCIRVRGNAAA